MNRRVDIEDFIKANFLSDKRHEHLVNYQVWTDNLKGNGYDKFCKIQYFKQDLLNELTGLDFVFVLDEEIWEGVQDKTRKAIIEHFLYRIEPLFEYTEDGNDKKKKCVFKDIPANAKVTYQLTKSGRVKYKIVKPFGEFPEMLKKYGTWNDDIKEIKNSLKEVN